MYRDSYQRGMLTVFFSCGSKPLNIWETHTQDGYITRFLDQDIKSMVLEIGGTNVSTTYMTCPKGKQVLGITMPFLVMIVKNLKKYFSFEVTVLDETGTRRRFRVSNFQSTTQILPLCTVMPIGLSDGWNQIQFNLAEFTRRAYKKSFVEVQKLKVNANIRLRRIYFAEKLIPEDQLPPEYKLYFPLPSKDGKGKKAVKSGESEKENLKPTTSQHTVKSDLKPGSKASLHSIKGDIVPAPVPTPVAEEAVVDEAPPDEVPLETAPVEGEPDAAQAVEESGEAGAAGEAPTEVIGETTPAAEGAETPVEATEAPEAAPVEPVSEEPVAEEPVAEAAAEPAPAAAAEPEAPPE